MTAKQIADTMSDASIRYGLLHNSGFENEDTSGGTGRVGFASPQEVHGVEHGARLEA